MSTTFFAADHHIDHKNILTFTRNDGSPVRPFSSFEEMQETIIARHNERVKPQDKVNFVGDFVMHKKNAGIAARFNGHKRLVRGNHDIHDLKYYTPYFDNIYGVRVFDGLIVSHIPLHPECLGDRKWDNLHGHVHNNVPVMHFGPRYLCCSVEMTDYYPVSLEEVREMFAKQRRFAEEQLWNELADLQVDGKKNLALGIQNRGAKITMGLVHG